jgi:uncharacterized protein YkwD
VQLSNTRRPQGAPWLALAAALTLGCDGPLDEEMAPAGGDAGSPVVEEPAPVPEPLPEPDPEPRPEPPPIVEGCATPEEARIIELANLVRPADAPLTCDPVLAEVARAHSQDMCNRDYFDHDNPDGLDPFDRMREADIGFRTAGENIAAGSPDPDTTHEGWMNSSGHRRNILDARYGRVGVGRVACPDGRWRWLWTQVFAN